MTDKQYDLVVDAVNNYYDYMDEMKSLTGTICNLTKDFLTGRIPCDFDAIFEEDLKSGAVINAAMSVYGWKLIREKRKNEYNELNVIYHELFSRDLP